MIAPEFIWSRLHEARTIRQRGLSLHSALVLLAVVLASCPAGAQTSTDAAAGKQIGGYTIHQMVDLGGHLTSQGGSGDVYDTMVNLHAGPRILAHTLEISPIKPGHAYWFDRLSSNSFGYGGEPNSLSMLNINKGRIYDFRGSFRRGRQYFDYDLLDNPLIPPTSSPDIQINHSPHLFNTVRRMTDLALTIAPLSPVRVHVGMDHNVSEGPSFSTVHEGTEALLAQYWRNSTDSWSIGLDWKPARATTLTYNQFFTYYKGDTFWRLAGLDYNLSDGTAVSLGIDVSSVWKTPCAAPFNPDGSVNPKCNAYLAYNRSAPTRTLFPTEQFVFQSASIPRVTLNGRAVYSGATSNLDHFSETFNGLLSRTALRAFAITGAARARRVNVNGDLSATWQITPSVAVTNVFDYWSFRLPGSNAFTETDFAGTSMLVAPGATTTTTTTDAQFLNQKTKTDTFLVAWDATSRARLSLGYRYRSRLITNSGGDIIPIHENWGLFGATLRPAPEWRININIDAMYADNAFTRISPRQLQHYVVRSTYKPRNWLMLSGAVNIHESRDNVQTVNHLEHSRDYSVAATITPSDRWSLDVNYGYDDVFSTTIECYTANPALPSAGAAPQVCVDAGAPLLSNGYYNAPTNFGSIGFTVSPVKRVHAAGGYRISSVSGHTDFENIRQVSGGLQSQYQTPYFNVALDLMPQWTWHANYDYYGYGEGSPIGPTLARNFHGNVYTLGVRYAF